MDLLEKDDDVVSFECNVPLKGVADNMYSTDFVITQRDGTTMIRECVWRFKRKKCRDVERAIDKAKAQRMAEFEAYALGQKKSYDASIDEVETLRERHEVLMVQLSEAEDKVRELNRMKVHECFAVTKLTEELLDEYVDSIEVHPGNEVRISWK